MLPAYESTPLGAIYIYVYMMGCTAIVANVAPVLTNANNVTLYLLLNRVDFKSIDNGVRPCGPDASFQRVVAIYIYLYTYSRFAFEDMIRKA